MKHVKLDDEYLKQCAQRINAIRISSQNRTYSRAQLKILFQNIEFPNSSSYLSEFVNKFMIKSEANNEYFFQNNPIGYRKIGEMIKDTRAKVMKPSKSEEDRAITMLKGLGYIIYRPV